MRVRRLLHSKIKTMNTRCKKIGSEIKNIQRTAGVRRRSDLKKPNKLLNYSIIRLYCSYINTYYINSITIRTKIKITSKKFT